MRQIWNAAHLMITLFLRCSDIEVNDTLKNGNKKNDGKKNYKLSKEEKFHLEK
jgi:hypothetical protein